MSIIEAEHTMKYLTVYNDLKEAILSGKYLRGSFLPTEVEMIKIYAVSRTTIRKAIALLQQENLVRVQQGRGTEVIGCKSQPRSNVVQVYRNVIGVSSKYLLQGQAASMSTVVDIVSVSGQVAERLELVPDTSVYRLQRLKTLSGQPYNYVVSYVPRELAPGLEKYSGQVFYLYQCLKDEYNVVSTAVQEDISAETAKFLESNLLRVTIGSPLLVTRRTTRYEYGVMEFTESYIRPDIYQISIAMQGALNYLSEDEPISPDNPLND